MVLQPAENGHELKQADHKSYSRGLIIIFKVPGSLYEIGYRVPQIDIQLVLEIPLSGNFLAPSTLNVRFSVQTYTPNPKP